MRISICFAGFALVLVLAGCAHQSTVQNVAQLSAAQVDNLKVQVGSFVDQANMLRGDAAQRNAVLQEQTNATTIDTAATIQTWKAMGDGPSRTATDVFNAVTAFGRSDALPITPAASAAPAVAQIKLDPAQYETLVKQLTVLATARSLEDEGLFLAGFGASVNSAYSADIKKASSNAKSAAVSGAAAASALPPP